MTITLSEQYLLQIACHYGQECADASVCELDGDGYHISIAIEEPLGYEVQGIPQLHTEAQVKRMIAVLSLRKPEKGR